jgi:predicted Fe-Mo cluster-binding NifX family protein
MKLAIAAESSGLDAPIATRFGRAPGFVLISDPNNAPDYLNNTPSLNAVQGAGIQAAQCVLDSGAEVVILRHCGPKAFTLLHGAGVAVLATTATTVREALAAHAAGTLTSLDTASVEGHWA